MSFVSFKYFKIFRSLLYRTIDQILTLFAVPIVFFMRLIRPLVLIRFGYFTCNRIGHFVFDVGYYIANAASIRTTKRVQDLFYLSGHPANLYFIDLISRSIWQHKVFRYLYQANSLFSNSDQHVLTPARITIRSRDMHGNLWKRHLPFEFDQIEDKQGEQYLAKIGCTGRNYVCLLVRDSGY